MRIRQLQDERGAVMMIRAVTVIELKRRPFHCITSQCAAVSRRSRIRENARRTLDASCVPCLCKSKSTLMIR